VDPDAVFFPDRLRANMVALAVLPDLPVYFKTCNAGFGLYGALEVFSRGAMSAYKGGLVRCKSDLTKNGQTWLDWGEDMWMAYCLDFLGVQAIEDFLLLHDAYCGQAPGDCKALAVTFHPLKSQYDWFRCFDNGASMPVLAWDQGVKAKEERLAALAAEV